MKNNAIKLRKENEKLKNEIKKYKEAEYLASLPSWVHHDKQRLNLTKRPDMFNEEQVANEKVYWEIRDQKLEEFDGNPQRDLYLAVNDQKFLMVTKDLGRVRSRYPNAWVKKLGFERRQFRTPHVKQCLRELEDLYESQNN